jgi:hypothetical protein
MFSKSTFIISKDSALRLSFPMRSCCFMFYISVHTVLVLLIVGLLSVLTNWYREQSVLGLSPTHPQDSDRFGVLGEHLSWIHPSLAYISCCSEFPLRTFTSILRLQSLSLCKIPHAALSLGCLVVTAELDIWFGLLALCWCKIPRSVL